MSTVTTRTSIRLRTICIFIAAAALVVAMVAAGYGSANLASLSGELPVDDPTLAEISTWETGHTLLWVALLSTIAAGTALAFAAATLRREWVLMGVIGGFVICFITVFLVAAGTWFVVLPRIG
ncbi:hypothetical protein [Microbacterium sp. VKM Ac-2923]|uniref:hypothetical protein n=1 Tax=Microbacterium sp. VKM Ac-2923 TaxID=2929476 RepID=UPI001FB376DA|nr:hypothetical protein [Microbacterium sp. VKM Ac-2923]MCJ1709542.1 hypothetical protein [Microbacterium sp. VKM Ac-2923]